MFARSLLALFTALSLATVSLGDDEWLPTLPRTIPPDRLVPGRIPIEPDDCDSTTPQGCERMSEWSNKLETERITLRYHVYVKEAWVASDPGDSYIRNCVRGDAPWRPYQDGSASRARTTTHSVTVSASTTLSASASVTFASKLASKAGFTFGGTWSNTIGGSYTYTWSDTHNQNVVAAGSQCWTKFANVYHEDIVAVGYMSFAKKLLLIRCGPPGGPYGPTQYRVCGGIHTITGTASKTDVIGVVQSDRPCTQTYPPRQFNDPFFENKKSIPACPNLWPCGYPGLQPTCCREENC